MNKMYAIPLLLIIASMVTLVVADTDLTTIKESSTVTENVVLRRGTSATLKDVTFDSTSVKFLIGDNAPTSITFDSCTFRSPFALHMEEESDRTKGLNVTFKECTFAKNSIDAIIKAKNAYLRIEAPTITDFTRPSYLLKCADCSSEAVVVVDQLHTENAINVFQVVSGHTFTLTNSDAPASILLTGQDLNKDNSPVVTLIESRVDTVYAYEMCKDYSKPIYVRMFQSEIVNAFITVAAPSCSKYDNVHLVLAKSNIASSKIKENTNVYLLEGGKVDVSASCGSFPYCHTGITGVSDVICGGSPNTVSATGCLCADGHPNNVFCTEFLPSVETTTTTTTKDPTPIDAKLEDDTTTTTTTTTTTKDPKPDDTTTTTTTTTKDPKPDDTTTTTTKKPDTTASPKDSTDAANYSFNMNVPICFLLIMIASMFH